MKKTWLILLTIATLSACNTIEGAGEDISKAGQSIGNAARNAGR